MLAVYVHTIPVPPWVSAVYTAVLVLVWVGAAGAIIWALRSRHRP
jgi:hypothetical protein